jgi:hypothetical protein
VAVLEEDDHQLIRQFVSEFVAHFNYSTEEILKSKFIKLFPLWLSPYGRLYAY